MHKPKYLFFCVILSFKCAPSERGMCLASNVYYTCDDGVCKTNAHPIDTNNHDMILPGRPTLQLTFNSEGFVECLLL